MSQGEAPCCCSAAGGTSTRSSGPGDIPDCLEGYIPHRSEVRGHRLLHFFLQLQVLLNIMMPRWNEIRQSEGLRTKESAPGGPEPPTHTLEGAYSPRAVCREDMGHPRSAKGSPDEEKAQGLQATQKPRVQGKEASFFVQMWTTENIFFLKKIKIVNILLCVLQGHQRTRRIGIKKKRIRQEIPKFEGRWSKSQNYIH